MRLHVLSGDSLVEPFARAGIGGEVCVFRECLVDGPVADDLEELFGLREQYLGDTDRGREFYRDRVVAEVRRVLEFPEDGEINLWFEHELFCQVNLWFLLSKLKGRDGVYAVQPLVELEEDRFDGWAFLGPDELKACFDDRLKVSSDEVALATGLWDAFARRNSERLVELSARDSEVFRYLSEVGRAASEIDTRPATVLQEIVSAGSRSFGEAFQEFREREPVWGFGDLQVKRMWDDLRSDRRSSESSDTEGAAD